MDSKKIIDLYFRWLINKVCTQKEKRDYEELLRLLNSMIFKFSLDRDANRAADGVDLRSRFAEEKGIDYDTRHTAITGPCTVLEMLVGLAVRAEFSMIDDSMTNGEDPIHWIFWLMLNNLGLTELKNEHFSHTKAKRHVNIFMNREYAPDGSHGGLFIVDDATEDLTEVEIWYQMCWYLSDIMYLD